MTPGDWWPPTAANGGCGHVTGHCWRSGKSQRSRHPFWRRAGGAEAVKRSSPGCSLVARSRPSIPTRPERSVPWPPGPERQTWSTPAWSKGRSVAGTSSSPPTQTISRGSPLPSVAVSKSTAPEPARRTRRRRAGGGPRTHTGLAAQRFLRAFFPVSVGVASYRLVLSDLGFCLSEAIVRVSSYRPVANGSLANRLQAPDQTIGLEPDLPVTLSGFAPLTSASRDPGNLDRQEGPTTPARNGPTAHLGAPWAQLCRAWPGRRRAPCPPCRCASLH